MAALSTTETFKTLEALGHQPNKRLGQNFLTDGNIVRKSLSLADVQVGDRVVEVGPGLGTLTRTLLEAGAEVYAIEYDRRLFEHIKSNVLPEYEDRLKVMHGDAVDHPVAGLEKLGDYAPYKIVANLPYAISTPWIEKLLDYDVPECMVLMLQKEAADRFTAQVDTKNFGAISIFLEVAYKRLPGHKVSRKCFHPVPGVDSVLLHVEKREDAYFFCKASKGLIRQMFTQRRKQIGSIVKKMNSSINFQDWLDWLDANGIPLNSRPQSIPSHAWIELDKVVRDQS